jgi:drug/metabolite transporter (DMT)-like permease
MSPQFLAWLTAVSFACANVIARQGLRYSTPITATFVSLIIHTTVLWSAVYFTVGVPPVALLAVAVIAVTGILQAPMRFFHYTGMNKIGASRAVTLRNTFPILSVLIGITALGESITTIGLMGAALVVLGIVLTSWRLERQFASFRWTDLLYPIATALITAVAHPLRRYALLVSDEPLFLAAIVGPVSLIAFTAYYFLPVAGEKLGWHRKALPPFVFAGSFETLAMLLMLMAFASGPVVIVSPIVATTPIWTTLIGAMFLREIERINLASIIGTICVVSGVIAISLVK